MRSVWDALEQQKPVSSTPSLQYLACYCIMKIQFSRATLIVSAFQFFAECLTLLCHKNVKPPCGTQNESAFRSNSFKLLLLIKGKILSGNSN